VTSSEQEVGWETADKVEKGIAGSGWGKPLISWEKGSQAQGGEKRLTSWEKRIAGSGWGKTADQW